MAAHPPFGEVIFSTSETSEWVSDKVAEGKLRKIGPTLYTTNLADTPEAIIRKNAWQIVAFYCPGAVITDRTGIEGRPAADGTVFVVSDRSTDVELPGLRIRPRKGHGPTADDRLFIGGLHMASPGRLLLENMRPSRARSGVSRTLKRGELESYLDRVITQRGPDALNRTRDEARRLAPVLGLEEELAELNRLIGGLLGSRPDAKLNAPVAIARAAGRPFDPARIEIFDALRAELASTPPNIRRAPALEGRGSDNLAFFEAYFSNFIEGTEFEIEEAADIVFNNAIPAGRPADAHDVLGTFRIVSNMEEMTATPNTAEQLEEMLMRRHAVIMEQRPDKKPGQFKDIPNRFGQRQFVDPDLVRGTLARGFEMYRSLSGAFERAAFMMYLVSEVHPFLDGNGRVARIMMNAELVAAGEQRIIIPIVYRNNYLSALRALSNDRHPVPLIRTFDFAQRYGLLIPWDSFEQARHVMTRTNAFMKPDEADEIGERLRLPKNELLQEAEDLYPSSDGGHRP